MTQTLTILSNHAQTEEISLWIYFGGIFILSSIAAHLTMKTIKKVTKAYTSYKRVQYTKKLIKSGALYKKQV